MAQAEAWLGPSVNNIPNNVMVTALPLYHIFALTCCCLYMMKIGASCLLIANPRDIPGFIATLKKTHFTLMSGVNTLYNALANHPDIRTVDFAKLKFCVAGGMATQSAVAKNWKSVSGCAIIEGYGLSETSPILTVNRVDLEEFSGTIGFPVPSTDVQLRDAEGKPVAPGEAGEICAKGPQVMQGYWNRPDETAKVMTADGFFRTGDVGVQLPDGTFKIVDRLKDMILVSGSTCIRTKSRKSSPASGRARSGGNRRSRSAIDRGRGGLHRQERPGSGRGNHPRALPLRTDGLQGAEGHPLP